MKAFKITALVAVIAAIPTFLATAQSDFSGGDYVSYGAGNYESFSDATYSLEAGTVESVDNSSILSVSFAPPPASNSDWTSPADSPGQLLPVPEPATTGLLLVAVFSLILLRKRQTIFV